MTAYDHIGRTGGPGVKISPVEYQTPFKTNEGTPVTWVKTMSSSSVAVRHQPAQKIALTASDFNNLAIIDFLPDDQVLGQVVKIITEIRRECLGIIIVGAIDRLSRVISGVENELAILAKD